jgi:sulfur-oxidizing protein SoxB
LVTNAGSHGKFLGVMDLQVRNAKVVDFRYRLLPVFADALPADPAMSALIERVRAPYADRLAQPLAVTDSLLYRRGNFSGSWDQLICDALLNVRDAQIALSPGFRWGTTLLPGQTITVERLMDQTAITYPKTYVTTMTGRMIHAVLEDVADNLFNPDPYYQQGGDMVRVSALTYRCDPARPIGSRITDLRLAGQPLDAGRRYRVAGWASVGPQGREPGEAAIWDVVQTWLSSQPDGRVRVNRINTPTLPPGWIAPHSGRTPA